MLSLISPIFIIAFITLVHIVTSYISFYYDYKNMLNAYLNFLNLYFLVYVSYANLIHHYVYLVSHHSLYQVMFEFYQDISIQI
jgi:hypothetical protein